MKVVLTYAQYQTIKVISGVSNFTLFTTDGTGKVKEFAHLLVFGSGNPAIEVLFSFASPNDRPTVAEHLLTWSTSQEVSDFK